MSFQDGRDCFILPTAVGRSRDAGATAVRVAERFDWYELQPCVEDGGDVARPASPGEGARAPVFWAVYGRRRDGTMEHVADRESYTAAFALYEELSGKRFPSPARDVSGSDGAGARATVGALAGAPDTADERLWAQAVRLGADMCAGGSTSQRSGGDGEGLVRAHAEGLVADAARAVWMARTREEKFWRICMWTEELGRSGELSMGSIYVATHLAGEMVVGKAHMDALREDYRRSPTHCVSQLTVDAPLQGEGRFAGYELGPCVVYGAEVLGLDDPAVAAPEEDVFWGLYGRRRDGTMEHIADRDSYAHAAELYQELTGKAAPATPARHELPPGTPEEMDRAGREALLAATGGRRITLATDDPSGRVLRDVRTDLDALDPGWHLAGSRALEARSDPVFVSALDSALKAWHARAVRDAHDPDRIERRPPPGWSLDVAGLNRLAQGLREELGWEELPRHAADVVARGRRFVDCVGQLAAEAALRGEPRIADELRATVGRLTALVERSTVGRVR